MRARVRKLVDDNRGETLIEVLAAVLITTLSVALLFTCIMASARMDDAAQELDAEHYKALSEAEAQADASPAPSSTSGIVTIERINPADPSATPMATAAPSIAIYGDEDGGLYSYKGK